MPDEMNFETAETVSNSFTPSQNIEIILRNSRDILSKDLMLQRTASDEYGLTKNYHGRELLELLQNADDAYTLFLDSVGDGFVKSQDQEIGVLFEFKTVNDEEILRISNCGAQFDAESLQSICRGHASTKGKRFIGNKGIGFRSVLNWAKVVRVYSGKYNFEFSEDIAQTELNKIKEKGNVAALLTKYPDLKYPILWAPKEISEKNLESGFDTTIELVIKQNSQNDNWSLSNQVDEFDECTLIFLRNIEKVSFKLPNKVFSFQKKMQNDSEGTIASVCKLDQNSIMEGNEKKFYVFKSDDVKLRWEEEEYNVPMTVAIPTDFSPIEKKMYTFFPIANVNCPFHALLHTSFILSDTRDSINSDAVNECVFEELLRFYVCKVCDSFSKPQFGNRVAELLTPISYCGENFNFPHPFGKEKNGKKLLLVKYLSFVREKLVLQTVNDQFVSLLDKPKLNLNYPSHFCGENFSTLVKNISNEEVFKFLRINFFPLKSRNINCQVSVLKICEKGNQSNELYYDPLQYTVKELLDRINALSENWTSDECMETFLWWVEHVGVARTVPNLLKRKRNSDLETVSWISKGIFFLSSTGSFSKIPDFAECSFLDEDFASSLVAICEKKFGPLGEKNTWEPDAYENSILRKESGDSYREFKDHEKRVIIHFLQKKYGIDKNGCVDIREYSVSNLIDPINANVVVPENCPQSYENAVKFVKWLRDNISEIESNKAWFNTASESNVTSCYFPCVDGSVSQIKNLYIGSEYGNSLGATLFSYTTKKAVAGPRIFYIDDDDSDEAVYNFLKSFAVDEFPMVKMSSLELSRINCGYKTYLEKLIKSTEIASQLVIRSRELQTVTVPYIEDFDKIVQNCDTEILMAWLLQSDSLREALKNDQSGRSVVYRVHTEGHGRPPTPNPITNFKGYLNFWLETIAWLKINDSKCKPQECILSNENRLEGLLNAVTDHYLGSLCGNDDLSVKELKDCLINLGISRSYVDLPVESFYKMLLGLPAKDPSGTVSSSIYLSCIKSLNSSKDALNKFREPASEREKFLKEGRLVVKSNSGKNGVLEFQPVSDVYFSNKAVPNVSRKYLLNVPLKNGAKDDMELLFGVKPFKEDFKLDEEESVVPSDLDPLFQTEFREYLPYALSLRFDSATMQEKSLFRRLEVQLVKSLKIVENSQSTEFESNMYTLFRSQKNNLWYIYVGDASNYKIFELSVKVEELFENICVLQSQESVSKFGELFRNKESRDSLIEYYGVAHDSLVESKKLLKSCDEEKKQILKYLEGKGSSKLDEIKSRIDNVFWGVTDDYEEQLDLIEFLKFAELSIEDVESIIHIKLDVCEALHVSLNREFSPEIKKIFSYHLWECFRSKGLDPKDYLTERDRIFNEIQDYEIPNDVNFDARNFVNKIFQEKFNSDLNRNEMVSDVDLTYQENFNRLREQVSEKSRLTEFLKREQKSCLYFDLDFVKSSYEEYILNSPTSETQVASENHREENESVEFGNPLRKYEPPLKKFKKRRKKNSGAYHGGDAEEKQEIGDIAEKMVYDLLTKHEIREIEDWIKCDFSIEWISGAAERNGQANADVDDSAGYDIKLVNKKNDEYYIEVKGTSSTTCQFYMSQNEIDFAESQVKHDRYRLIFVSNIKKGNKRNLNVLNPITTSFKRNPMDYFITYQGEE